MFRDLESSSSSCYREGDTLIHGVFPYKYKCLLQKSNCYSVFTVLPMFALLKNNQPKKSLPQKGIFWVVYSAPFHLLFTYIRQHFWFIFDIQYIVGIIILEYRKLLSHLKVRINKCLHSLELEFRKNISKHSEKTCTCPHSHRFWKKINIKKN